MRTPAQTPDKKRKLSSDTENSGREEGGNKLAKLEHIKQASTRKCDQAAEQVKPIIGQTELKPDMALSDMLNKLSPNKGISPVEGEKDASPEVGNVPQGIDQTLKGISACLEKLLEGQMRAEKNHVDLRGEMHCAIKDIRSEVQEVADRVKTLEEGRHSGQTSKVITKEERHEGELLYKIEQSRKCVTALGTGRNTMSIRDIAQLLQTSKLAEGDEIEVLSVKRLGAMSSSNPAFKVELRNAEMATALIESSRFKNARGEASFRCVVHYPQEYSARAREMKSSQAVAWRAGLQSQIYFEGTELCLKVKERNSNLWMMYPSEFGTFKPEMVASARHQGNDSEEVTAARASIFTKLGMKEDQGKLVPCELRLRSLLFSSKSGNLNEGSYAVKLPHIKEGQVVSLEAVKPSSEVAGEYQTRIAFKDRGAAKQALEDCMLGFKSKPMVKGDFLNLEVLWEC